MWSDHKITLRKRGLRLQPILHSNSPNSNLIYAMRFDVLWRSYFL